MSTLSLTPGISRPSSANRSDAFRAFFEHIQPHVGRIEEMQHYERTTVVAPGVGADTPTPPSLYEWAGGERALLRMIDPFYDEVEQLELFRGLFPDGVSERHRERVAAWLAEGFGGPAHYSSDLGGYDAMLDHHRGLQITPEQRASFVTLMSRAAHTAALPSDPEFRSALVTYLEWGTRLAFENSQPSATPFEGAPVPRWGWGEAPPYQPAD
ncbi:MAG: group II truncated hemoglobin [Actinomycetota bacterium]